MGCRAVCPGDKRVGLHQGMLVEQCCFATHGIAIEFVRGLPDSAGLCSTAIVAAPDGRREERHRFYYRGVHIGQGVRRETMIKRDITLEGKAGEQTLWYKDA